MVESSVYQRTIASEVELKGTGLHTGKEVCLRFLPAKEGQGVFFRRSDLPGAPEIPARVEYVFDTSRSTNLAVGDARVFTVEHVLAAVRALEIDNLCVEVDTIEPPAGNGSADVFIQLLEQAGIVEQKAKRVVMTLKEPVYWSDKDIHLVALPSDEFRVSYTLHYPATPQLKTQYHTFVLTPENFKKELAPCRTFALYEELSHLIDRGLIRGGSLENAVVIQNDSIVSKGGLHFQDEMVRHKILDLIGDLSLVGVYFKAHIISLRSGHASNFQLARRLYQSFFKENRSMIAKSFGRTKSTLDTKEIMRILPHRYPFLLVDKITGIDLEKGTISGLKNLTMNEAFFQGHFPGTPLMPGVLIIEALAQTGGILVHLKGGTEDKLAVLLSINNAKFRSPVKPGDTLTLQATGLHFGSRGGKVKAEAYVGDRLACEAELGFAIIEAEAI